MSLLDTILTSQGGSAVQQIGSQLGLNQDQTLSALSALVPALAAGVQRNAQTPDGLAGLLGALAGGQHQQYVQDPSLLNQPSTVDDGNGILGHIFGSKDVSRQVATHASATTGVSADILKRMLPLAATLVMGALARHQAASGSASASPTGFGGGGAGDLMGMLNATVNHGGSGNASLVGGVMDMLGKFLR
jgi:hypothetical protein